MQNNILKLEIDNKTKHLEKYIKPQWTWRTYLFLISLIAALTFVIIDLEINGLRIIDEQEVLNEITVFKGDELDPYVINRNIKRIEALGFFTSVESSLVDFEGGKKWIIHDIDSINTSFPNFISLLKNLGAKIS